MGTWSEEPFGNDAASDWAWDLDDAETWEPVSAALSNYLAGSGSDASEEEIVIAAAESVAHGIGSPTQVDEYTESVAAFVGRVGAPPQETVAAALEALRKVDTDEAELAQLWDDSGNLEEWRAALGRIRDALDK